MRKPLLLVGLCLMLGGCPSGINNNTIAPTPTPTDTPTPTPWLALDPVCTGAITRAEWLVCDNPKLNALHRQLAQQWATARQYATSERLGVLEDQLYALLSERDQCQDANCVSNAYRRYLDSPPPLPRPTAKPTKKPGKKPHRPAPGWPRDDEDGPSCVQTAGQSEALRLARQCDRVTPGRGSWSCRPQRSCGALRRSIAKGCNETYRKPEFCEGL